MDTQPSCNQTEFKNWISGGCLPQNLLVELVNLRNPRLNKYINTIGSIFDLSDPKNDYMQTDCTLNQMLSRYINNYYKAYFHEHMEIAIQQGIPTEHYTSYLAYALEQEALRLESHTVIDSRHWMITILHALDPNRPYTISASDDQSQSKDYLKLNNNTYLQLTEQVLNRFENTNHTEHQELYAQLHTGLKERYECEKLILDLEKPEPNLDPTKNMLTTTMSSLFEINDGTSIKSQIKIKKLQDFLVQCISSDSTIYVLDQPYIKRMLSSPGYGLTRKFIPIEIKELIKQLDTEDLSFEQRKVSVRSLIPNMIIAKPVTIVDSRMSI